VSLVVEGSAAAKAGLQAGDVITTVNGRAVANAAELRNTIGLLRIGDKVDIGLIREGKPHRVTAAVGDRDSSGAEGGSPEVHPALEGADLANTDNNSGVRVSTVAEGSPAAQSGLRANDLIVGVGRVRIGNLEQLRAATKNTEAFAIAIRRGSQTLVFPIG
jgi:S1-C subfamily serine protease